MVRYINKPIHQSELADENVPRPVLYPGRALKHNVDLLFVCFREYHKGALLSNVSLDHRVKELIAEAYL